jgi:hypothetical protein
MRSSGRDRCRHLVEPATMTVPLLTLLVLIVAFAANVGWLCWA